MIDIFHPLIRQWFLEQVGTPTEIQERAWPEIASGAHVLATAPTGSGKTLTAFLWAINRIIESRLSGADDQVRVLYISPLKALNNDIQRNLETPLRQLGGYFEDAGTPFPSIRTAVRSGDTSQSERSRMMKHPPDIFITTPESLNILLASKGGRSMLAGFSTVILDEIHAVAGSKREVYLMSAIERLTAYSGEFQRIALSATVKPLEVMADFIGGYRLTGSSGFGQYEKRKVKVLRSSQKKRYALLVDAPEEQGAAEEKKDWWKILSEEYARIIKNNTSTIIFTNSRRMVEKLTRFINDTGLTGRIYSHHGSLSKELRREVERELKAGNLSGIVATGSLELGIDIGDVDAVVLAQTPYSVSQAVQRIGRSGHGVGEKARGIFYPIYTGDLLNAAVLAREVLLGNIEEMHPVEKPLDVLAQMILSMTLFDPRALDELYNEIRCCWSYRNLRREEFDLVIEMLAGRYADTRIRELKPRLIVDRAAHTAEARENTRLLLYMSGGVIPDKGYFSLRAADTKAKIGELDEEFVWERSPGDAFPFGNRIWRIVRITPNDVEVIPAEKANSVIPFWRAEGMNRPFPFSEKIALFLREADGMPGDEYFFHLLTEEYAMSETAAGNLIAFLKKQKEATHGLPHRYRIILEHFRDPANRSDSKQTVLHTFWGGRVNRPFALALSSAWEEKFGFSIETYADNNCILINLPHEADADTILQLIHPAGLPGLLRKKLESTGLFGAHFRENAQRALLLPRRSFTKRMPLWLNRLRSKKLLEAVAKFEDFPVILETWRDCLYEDFDLETLGSLLEELHRGEITVSECTTSIPSPLADEIIWRQTNYYMYEDDKPGSKLMSNLTDELLEEIISNPELRPEFPDSLIEEFEKKLQRTAAGYAPDSPGELLLLLQDRLYIPADEWTELAAAVERDTGCPAAPVTGPVRETAASSPFPLEETEENSPGDFLSQWLRFYGPVSGAAIIEKLSPLFPSDAAASELLGKTIGELLEEGTLVKGVFRKGGKVEEICDRENLESLVRLQRAASRPRLGPFPLLYLQLFLASYQGLLRRGTDSESLQSRFDQLFGYPAKAHLWETDILPARLDPYFPEWLDTLMTESALMWMGCGRERTVFCFEDDLDLFSGPESRSGQRGEPAETLTFPKTAEKTAAFIESAAGKVSLKEIQSAAACPAREIRTSLWELAWLGLITNDTAAALRKGILTSFQSDPAAVQSGETGGGYNRFAGSRWQRSANPPGSWQPVKQQPEARGLIETEYLQRDRIRLLLLRYGFLFRELLQNELPDLRWSSLFRTLRLMELSGELFTGRFFEGIPGVQFCSPAALRHLQQLKENDYVYWMNAADPASLCGSGLEALKGTLPPRIASTHLVFHDAALVLISKRGGNGLEFLVPPEDERIPRYLSFFNSLLGRRFDPPKLIKTETINGMSAADSSYSEALIQFGFRRDYKTLRLRKAY